MATVLHAVQQHIMCTIYLMSCIALSSLPCAYCESEFTAPRLIPACRKGKNEPSPQQQIEMNTSLFAASQIKLI